MRKFHRYSIQCDLKQILLSMLMTGNSYKIVMISVFAMTNQGLALSGHLGRLTLLLVS